MQELHLTNCKRSGAMLVKNSIGLFSSALAIIAVASTPAFAEQVASDEAELNSATAKTELVNNEQSPAARQFEIHLDFSSAHTGSRIRSEGRDFSRPVTVISGDALRLDWRL